MKRASRSQMIVEGKPCNLKMLSMKILAVHGVVMFVVQAMKCACLLSLSTKTRIASCWSLVLGS